MEQKWRTSTNANRRQYVHSGVIDHAPQIIALQTEACEKYGETKDCLITMCGAGQKSDH